MVGAPTIIIDDGNGTGVGQNGHTIIGWCQNNSEKLVTLKDDIIGQNDLHALSGLWNLKC